MTPQQRTSVILRLEVAIENLREKARDLGYRINELRCEAVVMEDSFLRAAQAIEDALDRLPIKNDDDAMARLLKDIADFDPDEVKRSET